MHAANAGSVCFRWLCMLLVLVMRLLMVAAMAAAVDGWICMMMVLYMSAGADFVS